MALFGCDYLEIVGTFLPEYRCKYSRQTLSARTAQDVCMTSRYYDCADFKNATRCFITSAVCLTLGKPDNCEELRTMRMFRDEWLRDQPGGEEAIEEYYKIAPEVVKSIDCQPDRLSIYETIYKEYILPCVECAKEKNFSESSRIYVSMMAALKAQYT